MSSRSRRRGVALVDLHRRVSGLLYVVAPSYSRKKNEQVKPRGSTHFCPQELLALLHALQPALCSFNQFSDLRTHFGGQGALSCDDFGFRDRVEGL